MGPEPRCVLGAVYGYRGLFLGSWTSISSMLIYYNFFPILTSTENFFVKAVLFKSFGSALVAT